MKNLSKKTSSKILSFLLLVSMLVTMFPAAGFGESSDEDTVSSAVYDEAITAFDPITIEAGTAGSASYEDAQAVIDYLEKNYSGVTAQTDNGTVEVPVTGWEDTGSYDPATAGSYTFTATLGELPEGYTNPDDLAATADVVVEEASSLPPVDEGTGNEENEGTEDDIENEEPEEGTENQGAEIPAPLETDRATVTSSVYEITGFEAIGDIDGGTIAAPTYANADAVKAHLTTAYPTVTARVYGGGTVPVSVTSWTDSDSYKADVAGSYTFTAALDIPQDYTLGDDVTATIEVEVTITDPDAEDVNIPDANLKNAICEALGKPSDYTVTVGDMKSLTELDASDLGITDLTGLWTAVNLEKLDLSGNPLDDAKRATSSFGSFFQNFTVFSKLEHLDLSDCRLGDNSLGKYNNNPMVPGMVQELRYYVLPNLPSLVSVDLSDNGLAGYFQFQYNGRYEHLTSLDLSGNRLNQITEFDLSKFPALKTLDLSDNYLYWDEGAGSWIEPLILAGDVVKHDSQKNLGDLFSVQQRNKAYASTSSAAYKYIKADNETYTLTLEDFSGDTTVSFLSFGMELTTKVTVGDAKVTAATMSGPGTVNNDNMLLTLTGYSPDSYQLPVTVMHLNGDTREYTLKFNVTSVSGGTAGITDPALQAAVCTKLGQPTSYSVTQEDMAGLTGSLNVYNAGNVEGIQYAAGLTSLRLTGTFTEVPDLSGLTKLTSLYLLSDNIGKAPDLSKLTALTSLTIYAAADGYPDLLNQTKLKTLILDNVGTAADYPAGISDTIKTLEVCRANGKTYGIPEQLTGLTSFAFLPNTDAEGHAAPDKSSAALDLTNISKVTAPGSLSVTAGTGTTAITGLSAESAALKSMYIYLQEGVVLPEGLATVPNLTGTLTIYNNTSGELPDSYANLTKVTSLTLTGSYADVPPEIASMTELATLRMQYCGLAQFTADLSNTKLTSLYLEGNKLTQMPFADLLPETLQTLDLTLNQIKEVDDATAEGYAKMTALKTLELESDPLVTFPSALIKNLPALTTLNARLGRYEDIPADSFDNSINLKTVRLGSAIKIKKDASGVVSFAEGTGGAAAVAKLKTYQPNAYVSYEVLTGLDYAILVNLSSSVGAISEDLYTLREISLSVPEGTSSVTLTPDALLSDTVITVNGQEYLEGQEILIDNLAKGSNTVTLSCYNGFQNYLLTDTTVVYTLNILVGDYVDDFPAEGHTYSVKYRIYKNGQTETLSMADNYFTKTATVTYEDSLFVIDFTTTKASWIPDMHYYLDGELLAAELVEKNNTTDQATYRIYARSLNEVIVINPYVVPMGYAPKCDLRFDTSAIIDITDGEDPEEPLDPDNLPNGQYSIDADAMHETQAGVKSMADQFITEDTILTVEDGEITATMVWHRTNLITMDMVEGLWYQDSQGNMIPVPGVPTEDTETLTITIPVESITAPTMMQVYAPQGMAENKPYFKLVFNTDTLTRIGDPDPDKEPVETIGDGSGTVSFEENHLPATADRNQNIGLNLGDVSVNIPLQYLDALFSSHPGQLNMHKQETTADTKTKALQIIGSSNTLIGSLDLNLTMGSTPVSDLGGRIKITINLTDAQVEALLDTDQSSRKLYYYNPEPAPDGSIEDMNADFDLTAKTVSFYTDHLSTYVLVGTTSTIPGGDGGGGDGNPHGLDNGTYNIKVRALMEDSDDESMADQFFIEPAQLDVYGEEITVTVVMYGTASSPEKDDGIHMSYIKKLQYKNLSGSWENAIEELNNDEDTLTAMLVTNTIDEPVYMRTLVPDYMGNEYKIFRLVFNKSSLKKGGVNFGSSVNQEYIIKAEAGEGGSISPEGEIEIERGEDQTFTITANTGYIIKDVLVDEETVGAVSTYTFENVKKTHTIKATFAKPEEIAAEETPQEEGKTFDTSILFDDTANHWAQKAISVVVSKNIFTGTGDNKFSPGEPMTRGMFVTTLGRMHKIDTEDYTQTTFTDVGENKYYAPYVAWAVEKGIAKGLSGSTFGPEETITREQAAVMFANYLNFAGINLEQEAEPEEPDTTDTEAEEETTGTEEGLAEGKYTIEATALKENNDELSMSDQFLTEKATLTVAGGTITASMTWHGTEYITMDMLKELKYQKSDGSFVETPRTLSADNSAVTLTFPVADINKATIFQVYVPEGMGEMRPKFRLVFDTKTLSKTDTAAPAAITPAPSGTTTTFADEDKISDWARESVHAMQRAGIIQGDANNNFNPRSPITRAEAAVIFARSLGFKE